MVTVYPNADLSLFQSLCKTAEAEGQNCFLRHEEATGNRFACYQKKDGHLYLYYIPGRNEIRFAESPGDLPPSEPDQASNGALTLYQIDLDNRRINCGMSYVFQLKDGRFFILDGGYFTNGECDRLYSLLRSLCPEGKLPIAGWFFSHAHQDHFGCFMDFITCYRSECKIEGLYYTFPSLSLPEAARWKASDNASIREFEFDRKLYLPDVPVYSLHTGEVFEIGGLKLEVLFTHEDIYPEKITSFNDTSTVLMANADGCKILFLGDLHTSSCRKLEAMQAGRLKADVVQVAHHGFNGSTIETYDLTSPAVALWPVPDYGFDDNTARNVNAHLLAMECVKEHLVAGYTGTIALPMPYTPGQSVKIELPKKD